MSEIYTYLDELHKQKQRLTNVLNNRGYTSSKTEPLSDLVDRLESRGSDTKAICFRSAADQITIRMIGSGEVLLCINNEISQNVELTNNIVEISMPNTTGEEVLYHIDNADGLVCLDLHGNQITEFSVNKNINLKRLVLFDNNITKLDCSRCDALQFLHIFSNPLCDDETYEGNLVETISGLVDRAKIATGSVIFYPWYGLEKLICLDSNSSAWVKYPTGRSSLTLEDGRLYGVVDGNNITYYIYDEANSNLKEHTEMNRHHSIRKDVLEPISLSKNWVFGSAIMYDEEEWAKCPWDFRQNHIADMWETAEKGFGLTWGSLDSFTLMFDGAEDLNVINFTDYTGRIVDYASGVADSNNLTEYNNGGHNHGDAILSIVCGTGLNQSENSDASRYGYAPLCKLQLMDKVNGAFNVMGGMSALTEESYGCDTLSFSISYNPSNAGTFEEEMSKFATHREAMYEFGNDHIITVASGNAGDDLDYSVEDTGGMLDVWFGNLTTDEADGHSTTIFTTALLPDNTTAPFSPTSRFASRSKFTPVDYMAQYGSAICIYRNALIGTDLLSRISYGDGTSYAAPALNAVLMLMRIIYSKMQPSETSFGKFSPFMNHVRERWSNRLLNQMDFSAGYGMPDIFAEPVLNTYLSEEPLIVGDRVATLAKPYRYVYRADALKNGFTLGYNLGELAVTRDGDIYPMRPTITETPAVYSNSARHNVETVDDNGVVSSFYGANYYKNTILTDVVPSSNESLTPLSGDKVALTSAQLSYPASGTEVLSVDKTTCNNCEQFTAFLVVGLSPDKLIDASNVGYQDLMYFQYDEDKWGYLRVDELIYSSTDNAFDFSKAMFACRFEDTSGQNLINHRFMRFLDSFVRGYTNAVITVASAEDGIHFYYNGNHMSFIPQNSPASLSLHNTYVSKAALFNSANANACTYFYNRAFTDDEIAVNAAAILKSIE